MDEVCPLRQQTIDLYNEKGKGIIAGWEVKPRDSDLGLRVLLDEAFPFSHIKIACIGACQYLQWPHVEENGFLCLPIKGWRPVENLAFSIRERIDYALQLVDDCRSQEFVKDESSKEFLSYWGRGAASGSKTLSLIDLSVSTPRRISVVQADEYSLVAESLEVIDKWLQNQGKTAGAGSKQAIFACIDSPPGLPLPRNTRQFLRQIVDQCREINPLISQLSPSEPTHFFFAVRAPEGLGLIGAKISPAPQNGFRKPKRNGHEQYLSARRLRAIWSCFGKLTLLRVERVDGAWVHGRGQDDRHQILANKRVVILGCGSLGSQVAARMGQAGIGDITLVDPERLSTSNVGRHSLGINDVMYSKAKQLENMLSKKYPHSIFKGLATTYQAAIRKNPAILTDADLFVNCIAETDQDLSWDALRRTQNIVTPTVYGWIGTQGTTGHALALSNEGPGLSCFFDPDGFLRKPDTDFQGDSRIKVEPGCGTEFQPYGPLAAGQVELLVTRLCLDILTGKVIPPHHRVYACSTNDLTELGGQWTEHHEHHRPNGYSGPFEYTLPVSYCGDCYLCQML